MSSAILSFLLSYLLLYKYVTLFVAVFLAAIILPLPISTVLVAVGAFSSQGYFSFWLSLLVAVVSNVIGDSIAYSLTRWYRDTVDREKVAKSSRFFGALDVYFKKYAALTIILSRFTAVSGSIVNFLAGFSATPFSYFVLCDAIGNTIDTGFYIGFGYVVGDYWQNFSGSLEMIGWIALILFLIIVVSKLLHDRYWKALK